MSYLSILVHCVWTTHNRIPYLTKGIRSEVISHIRENSISKGIYIDHINGYDDHLHALISMGANQTISVIMQQIKGESSYWINKNNLTGSKLQWQDDYYAVSIGSRQLDILRKYIRNQELHHQKVLIQDELDVLIKEYGLKKMLD